MLRKSVWMLLMASAMGFAAMGCNDSSDDDGNDTGSENENDNDAGDSDNDAGDNEGADEVTMTLNIPDTFDGTPQSLVVMFFESETAPMPAGTGSAEMDPEIVAGEPFEFTSVQGGLEGDYFLRVTLYCEGGGLADTPPIPVADVDWVGGTGEAITLGPGTGTVDAGEMELFPFDSK